MSNHTHDHDHDHEEMIELDTMILTFEGEDGEDFDVECGVLGIFDVEEESYIALVVPQEDEDGEELEDAIFIYKYREENGEPILDVIEDDVEFQKVQDEVEETFFIEEE